MRTDVVMPQMGESVAEGTVTRWLKKVGDKVERDEPLLEISTDKVDAEIPSPVAGYLTAIVVGEGKTVAINTVLAVISERLEDVPAAASPASPSPTQVEVPAAPALEAAAALPTLPDSLAEVDVETLRKVRSSPVVRKIAQEHGVDIRTLQGTGVSGRVTRQDILGHLETRGAQPAPMAVSGVSSPAPTGGVTVTTVGGAVGAASSQPVSQPGPSTVVAAEGTPVKASISLDIPAQFLPIPGPRDTVQAMSPMRKKIAEHMSWSRRISPHVASFLEVDMTRVVRLREAHKARFQAETGEKLTFMPFIMQAAIAALKAYPDCNASVRGEEIIYHPSVHLGVAVALDWGLIVPVVKHADEKNLVGLTRALNDLASRARAKKLSPDEVAGGTFSITNPGAFGSLTGLPIIPQPQVAILGVGALNKRPWVLEGPEGDVIAIRQIMMLSLSYDHRLVDGSTGSKFLNHIRDFLQDYSESMLK